MRMNVEKVIERDQKLSELDDRAERSKLVHSRSNSNDYLNNAGI
jgi:hypothetical protein